MADDMPGEKPCYFCGKKEKIWSSIVVENIPMRTVQCKTCLHIDFFLGAKLGSGREIPKESVPPEVRRQLGI